MGSDGNHSFDSYEADEQACSYLRTEAGHRIALLPNRVYFFGRGDSCDVRLDDVGCSRQHAKISVAGDPSVVHIEDCGSKNGTWVGAMKTDGRVQLREADRVRIGNVEYVVQIFNAGVEIDLDTKTSVFKKG